MPFFTVSEDVLEGFVDFVRHWKQARSGSRLRTNYVVLTAPITLQLLVDVDDPVLQVDV